MIKDIRQRLYEPEFEKDLQYLGIAICGAKKKVNKLAGSILLLR